MFCFTMPTPPKKGVGDKEDITIPKGSRIGSISNHLGPYQ